MKKLNILFLMLMLAGNSFATNYYVAQNDPSAVNTNPGTEALPFETIQAAADVATGGDTVFVKAGTYRETVIPANSGSSGNSIVFQVYGNDNVTISGAEEITGWTHQSGNIYYASMAADYIDQPTDHAQTDQVFVDKTMLHVARWPNLTGTLPKGNERAITSGASRTGPSNNVYTGTLTDADVPSSLDYTGAEIFYYPDTGKWTWSFTGWVTNVSSSTITFETYNGATEDGGTGYANVSKYFIFNAYDLLDVGGEFYHDESAGRLYLITPTQDDPSTHTVEAKKRQYGFNLSGKSYIEVRGFNLFACTVTTDDEAGSLGGSETGYDASGNTIYPWRWSGSVASSSHCTIDRLVVEYPDFSLEQMGYFNMQWGQNSGIVLGGTDHVVKNCHIKYCCNNGISCIGERHDIYNNIIEDVNFYGRGYAGVSCGQSGADSYDHEIHYNTIRRAGRIGIHLQNIKNSDINNQITRVHHNLVEECCLQDQDCAGIRATGDKKFLRIDHNIVRDTRMAYINSGIYCDYTKNTIIDHNVVYNMWSTIHLNYGDTGGAMNHIVYNNTLVSQNKSSAFIRGPFNFSGGGEKTGLVIQNNICWIYTPPAEGNYSVFSGQYDGASFDSSNNVLNADPLFVTYPDDLQLTASSTNCIDQGVTVPDYTRDGATVPAHNDPMSGSAIDIGAYEYGQPKWTAGATTTTYTLTIVSANGTVTPTSGSTYPENSDVQVVASGNSGYVFDYWTGDVDAGSENDNPLTITMDSDKTITANYSSVTTYILTTDNDGNGSVILNPAGGTYNENDTVQATPDANTGYVFDKWTGNVDLANETDNPLNVVMDADKSITAIFVASTGSTIKIYAAGSNNQEDMELLIDDNVVASYQSIGGDASTPTYVEFVYDATETVTGSQVKVKYHNDWECGGDLRVDKIIIDGVAYESEDAYATGSWTAATGCGDADHEWLHCDGYFHYDQLVGENLLVVNDVNVCPNPFEQGMLNIKVTGNPGEIIHVYIQNILGKTVYDQDVCLINKHNSIEILNRESLSEGMYIIQIGQENQQQNFRLIVQ